MESTSLSQLAPPASVLWRRYEEELAYYRADAVFLTLEKCAERARMLSALYTLARLSSQTNTNTQRRTIDERQAT
jgi:hypothetical protein